MGGERQRVGHKPALLECSHHRLLTLGALTGPVFEDLGQRPCGQGPDELLLRWQITICLHDLECVVDHRGAIALHHVAGHVGVTDIEVGLEHHDHLAQRSRNSFTRLQPVEKQHQRREQADGRTGYAGGYDARRPVPDCSDDRTPTLHVTGMKGAIHCRETTRHANKMPSPA